MHTTGTTTAPVLTLVDGAPTTTSLDVAAFFGKRHDAVLRDIRNVTAHLPADHAHNFVDMMLDVETGKGATRQTPAIRMSKKGFTLLAMGFTGARAMAFKLAYIDAFERMEAQLSGRALPAPAPTRQALQRACNQRVHALALAYEAQLAAQIRRAAPATLDAVAAWQPPAEPTLPGPQLTREQWRLLDNKVHRALALSRAALESFATAADDMQDARRIINAAAQLQTAERDAICAGMGA